MEAHRSREDVALVADRVRELLPRIGRVEHGVDTDGAAIRGFARQRLLLFVGSAENELGVEIIPRQKRERAWAAEERELLQLAADRFGRRARCGIGRGEE